MYDIKLSSVIAPHFYEVHRDIKQHNHTEYVFKGGRGSMKSSTVGLEVPLLIKRNPNVHVVALRQVKDTLKDSVYAQIVWAIEMLGLTHEFKCTLSPLQIVYKKTGQTIYFRGADDPYKIKSIKPPFGYIGVLWFEELDTFKGVEAVRNIEQSVIRGGDKFWVFKTFNPPITNSNWANKYAMKPKDDMLLHHSTYLTSPPNWLGKKFIDDAEYLQQTNERAYRHEYLGEATGTGGNVFENAITREITHEETSRFDRIYQGIDWGYYPDPYHFGRMHFDSARRDLYIFGEYRDWKKGNQLSYEGLVKRFPDVREYPLIADSAEQKSVADYRSFGLHNVRGAVKGPNSVHQGLKWLQSLNRIIIDPVRCPYTAQEFLEYEYERNKDGEIISGYPDKNNHAVDMVRYALEPVWRRRGQ